VQSLDRSRPLENSDLWRRVDDQPLRYVPHAWPQGAATTAQRGDWIKDPQDGAEYFVPKQECGGRPPGVWRGEAVKSTNRYTREEQRRRNAATVLIGWPLELAGWTALGMAGAGAGGFGGAGLGSVRPGAVGSCGAAGACGAAGGCR
jgi:hypothetical protein